MSCSTLESSQARVKIGLLGPFEIQIEGRSVGLIHSRKEQWLLAILALRNGKEITRSQLAGMLWTDSTEENALANLRSSLYLLRRTLGAEAVRLKSPTPRALRFDLTDTFTDVIAFDAAQSRSDTDSLETLTALYRGPLLEGCDEPWIVGERQAREQAYQQALETLGERARQRGRPTEALPFLRLLIQRDPLRESAHRSLMQALADDGDYAAMVLVYRNLRLLLRREINEDPAPETVRLYESLRSAAMQEARSRSKPVSMPHPTPAVTAQEAAIDATGEGQTVASAARSETLPRPGTRLPRPLTPLIGRSQEIETVQRCLEASPLVTLTGTGGVGKTRIALQVAQEWAQKEETWFVELVSLTNPAFLAQAVARDLQVVEEPGTPLEETLSRWLAGHPGLLVLDNGEHLLDACARLTENLLRRCPGLHILVTSRQALGIMGEVIAPISGLEMPPPTLPARDTEPDWLSSLRDYEAIRLFVERAQAAMPAFRLTPQNSAAVIALCRYLGGIPLAIELTAAWISVLTPEQMLSRQDRRLSLLVSRRPEQEDRHRSLAATLDWSCQRLEPELHRFLTGLSVFRGGWTLEAAEAVCLPAMDSASGLYDHVLESLALLQERSLLQTSADRADMRYSLLEIVREYVGESLADAERERLMQRHADYFLALAEEAAAHLTGPQQAHWLDRLETERDNLRAALTWCIQDEKRTGMGLRFGTALWRFWDVRGYHREGDEWLTGLLARDIQEPPALRASGRESLGLLLNGARDPKISREWSLQALALYEEKGDRMGVARTLCSLAIAELNLRQIDTAQQRLETCLPVLEAEQDAYELGRAFSTLGSVAQLQGDLSRARTLFQQSADSFRTCRHLHGVALSLYRLGGIAMVDGRYAEARRLFLDALALTREVEDRITLPFGLFHLGQTTLAQNHLAEAQTFLNEAIVCSRVAGTGAVEGTGYFLLADIAVREQDIPRALSIYLEAAAIFVRENLDNGVCLIAGRLAALAIQCGQEALAVRLYGFSSLHVSPSEQSPPRFYLYMSLGYLFISTEQYEADLRILRTHLPNEFETLWQEGRAISPATALPYLSSLQPLFS